MLTGTSVCRLSKKMRHNLCPLFWLTREKKEEAIGEAGPERLANDFIGRYHEAQPADFAQ